MHEFIEPYTFPSYHTRILEPYNYYEFGQNYVRTLINFETSVVSLPWASTAVSAVRVCAADLLELHFLDVRDMATSPGLHSACCGL